MTQVIKEIFDVLVERKQIENGVRKAHRVVKIKRRKQKGRRWMPWLEEAMKDVVSCDKRRVGANNL